MRVNVYAEEMTDRVEIITKEIDGQQFTGLRIYLELPATVNGRQYQGPFIHRPGDDDSSAVTFWGKRDLRVVLRKALDELDQHYAESQFAKVGVVSGPGQPIDLAERMDKRAERLRVHDWSVSDSITAQILREAAAEVRRLRAERDAYKAGLDVARDSDREAAQLIERGCRAGIEAAARWLEAQRGDNIATPVYPVREFAAAIRALAAWDAAAHRRSGDKYFALLNAEIAARKGG